MGRDSIHPAPFYQPMKEYDPRFKGKDGKSIFWFSFCFALRYATLVFWHSSGAVFQATIAAHSTVCQRESISTTFGWIKL